MKTFLIVMGLVLAVMAGWMGSAFFQVRRETVQAKLQADQARAQVQDLSNQLAALTADKNQIEQRLQGEMTATAELKAKVEQLTKEDEDVPLPPMEPPQPFRVRAYLGRESLGEAWMLPTKFVQDPKTGRATYEPVLVLDEKLRKQFTVYETNYVAEPVNTTVNYNYTPPRTYYYPFYYPVAVRGHRGSPGAPDQPSRPDRPSRPSPQPGPSFPIFPVRGAGGGGSGSPWGSVPGVGP